MTHPTILCTRPLPAPGADLLKKVHEAGQARVIQWGEDSQAPRAWVLAELRKGGVNALVIMLGDKIDDELLEAGGDSLRVISTMSAGYDHVNTASLAQKNITLGTTPDALTDATADIGAMLVLMASRRAGEGLRAVASGKWPHMPWSPLLLCGHALQKSTVGVLGFGKIGQLTLKRLLGFGIGRALYATSRVGATLPASKDYFNLLRDQSVPIEPASSLEQLAAESDFLVICCTLTPSTNKLIDSDFISKMKKNAYIVNTSRGPVVDSDALVKAIDEGRLAGAGLDVAEGEPNIDEHHPLVKCEKVVLLPHVGSATYETRGLMSEQAVVNALAGLGLSGYKWENQVELK